MLPEPLFNIGGRPTQALQHGAEELRRIWYMQLLPVVLLLLLSLPLLRTSRLAGYHGPARWCLRGMVVARADMLSGQAEASSCEQHSAAAS